MKGILSLKSPMELDFEGISEIQKNGEDIQDIHDFPMTTKFINMEISRSRAGTMENKKNIKKHEFNLNNSNISLKKKSEELDKLFKNKKDFIENSELTGNNFEIESPNSIKVRKLFINYFLI